MTNAPIPLQLCGFEWHGRDDKDHACDLVACHAVNYHECDCGERKYAGPDPTAWRRKQIGGDRNDVIPVEGFVS